MRFFLLLVVVAAVYGFVPRGLTKRRLGGLRVAMEEPNMDNAFEERNDVYIGNMPFDLEEGELKDMVSSALDGDSASNSVRIIRDRDTGRSRGFGYISFDTKDEAEASVSKLEGLASGGRDFRVNVSVPKDQRPPRPPRENKPRFPEGPSIFMGNLDFNIADTDVMTLCEDILGEGVVRKVRIATDRDTGRSRGFGHLDFETQEEADTALEKLAGCELAGRALRVDIAQRREDRPKRQSKHSVFVGNLSWDIDTTFVEDMLDDILGPGSFESVRLATDNQTGRIRGFGHVDFKDSETAARAVIELNGMEVLGRQLRVDHAEKKF